MDLETVIGLEVHAQLLTATKIFCGCSTNFGLPPNSLTCPICLALPGTLPSLNRKVVEFAMKMALATGCRINRLNTFARKNYFYPDLPKGYQISQDNLPLAEGGHLLIELEGEKKKIGITRIHMEEDAGKLIHDEAGRASYVDLNRAGVPLIEIVSEPDIRSPAEASAYLKSLHEILVYLEICDGNMEEGSFRCDANISLRPRGQDTFGRRTELKNLNSFRHVQRALEYEVARHTHLIESGLTVEPETRLWDEAAGVTVAMRSKGEEKDYRLFPEPDLVPVEIDDAWMSSVMAGLPELPQARRERFVRAYGIPAYDAGVLTSEKELAEYYERVVKLCDRPKIAANWIMGDVMKLLNEDKRPVRDCPISPGHLAKLIGLIEEGVVSGKMAKEIIEDMYKTGSAPAEIIAEKGMVQITDEDELAETIAAVIADNPGQHAQYRSGKDKLFGYFVGQVMKRTAGKANPQLVNDLLKKALHHD